jgi:signal transduction histidine kinase
VMQFSQLLLQELPSEASKDWETGTNVVNHQSPISSSPNPDVELLQAFAHEVRTPLTTIRTMTRLLLKRRDLPANVINRLEVIDHECTEQIDRMELLFKAAELETCTSAKSANTHLTPMSLDQVLQQSIPRWQQAANRRNLTLDVVLPQQLPTVVSNPNMLDRVLTGLMENFTRNLPAGSHIQVQVIPAGDQLKLQLSPQPQCQNTDLADTTTPPIRKALGQLLMFQPETGTISLNLNATKHLFQAIGGKLIVRQRPQYGEVLTIFLPLEVNNQQNKSVKCEV